MGEIGTSEPRVSSTRRQPCAVRRARTFDGERRLGGGGAADDAAAVDAAVARHRVDHRQPTLVAVGVHAAVGAGGDELAGAQPLDLRVGARRHAQQARRLVLRHHRVLQRDDKVIRRFCGEKRPPSTVSMTLAR